MTEKPILALSEAIGRDATDKVSLSYCNATTEWTTKQIQARFADTLAGALSEQGQNVYVMVNTAQDLVKGRGKVDDIIQVNALWADLDIKPGGMPTMEAAQNVIDSLSAILNCRPAAIVHSGGGLQPYWELEDATVSELNRNYMVGLLKRWGYLVARIAEIEGGKVDSVFDLPRVLRAPGTLNYKYDPPAASTIEIGEWTHPITLDEVEELVQSYGFLNEDITVGEFVVVAPPEDWEPATLDCEWARSLAREIDKGDPGARHPWLLGKAVKIEVAARNGCMTQDTYGATVALLEAKFKHLLTLGKHPRTAAPGEVNTAFKWARASVSTFSDAKMADNLNYHTHKPTLYAVPDLPKESGSASAGIEAGSFATDGALALIPDVIPVALADDNFAFTDAANAERLANAGLGSYTFVPGLGWHVWRGGRYVRDETNSVIRLAIDTAREYAAGSPGADTIKWAQRSMSAPSIAAAVRLTESIPEMVTLTTSLDANALELCTPHGIVDLDRGELRPADPLTDLNTRQTAVAPRPGPMPKFARFLRTTLDDPERIDYMQDLFGVALIGEIRWHILPIFSGGGANGKSTLLDIAGSVLGDYSAIMPENFLLDGTRTEHSTEIARLRGVRLAIASETRPDGKFNESRVKMLTAEPVLSARTMGKDFMDFKSTHTLFLALNHPPTVRSGGDGFWRRIRKIDFNHQVPKHLRDPNLAADIVAEEGPQVLHWMIEGARRVLQRGLIEPPSIEEATAAYREEEDHVDGFLKECTDLSEHATHTAAEIYGTYVAWCRRSGETPMSNVSLMRDIRQRMPIVPFRTGRYRGWKGMMIYVNEE